MSDLPGESRMQSSEPEASKLTWTDPMALPLTSGQPPVWVDVATISVRVNPALVLLRCFSVIPPDGRVEVARLQMTLEHFERMLNAYSSVKAQLDSQRSSQANDGES